MNFNLIKITFNKDKNEEDRVISGYETLDDAIKAFYNYMSENVLGKAIGWCYACIMDADFNKVMEHKWSLPETMITTEADVVAVINKYIEDHSSRKNAYDITMLLEQNLFNTETAEK